MNRATLLLYAFFPSVVLSSEKSAVVELTTRSFAGNVTEGTWLVEFYAPWCGHCKNLAPTYETVAVELKGEVHVAKIDGSVHRGLAARFGVNGYPAIYHVHQRKVRLHAGARTKDAIMHFARAGFESVKPLSFIRSPFSPLGRAKGLVVACGHYVVDFYAYCKADLGMVWCVVCARVLYWGRTFTPLTHTHTPRSFLSRLLPFSLCRWQAALCVGALGFGALLLTMTLLAWLFMPSDPHQHQH